MKTIVYVDGFNFYYGCVKNTRYKWLDISKLCSLMLPGHQIVEIKYFTAIVKPRKDNPDQQMRQNIYLRALRTIPNLTIIKGHFQSNKIRLPLANCNDVPAFKHFLRRMSLPFWKGCIRWAPKRKALMATVVKTSEKGSDVNLATHLLHDAYRDRFEVAVVISGDSDLLEAIRIVAKELKKSVGVVCPQPRPPAMLLQVATFYKQIRETVLSASQFPDTMKDSTGAFHKPIRWR